MQRVASEKECQECNTILNTHRVTSCTSGACIDICGTMALNCAVCGDRLLNTGVVNLKIKYYFFRWKHIFS